MIVDWPLVGRGDLLAKCGELLGAPTAQGFVLTGDAGVGKSHLLHECARHAEDAGFAVLRATAHRSSSDIPFGALASLLPSGTDMVSSGVPLLRQAGDALAELAGGSPLVLALDDAHLLDSASTLLVYQLVATRRIFAMVSVCSNDPAPEAIAALWRDGRAERIEVEPLGRADVGEIAVRVLGGPIDAAAIDALFLSSAGNAMVLRELVRGSLEVGALAEHRGLWRVRGSIAPSRRLREMVEQQLARLDSAQRAALELIALGEPLGLDVALHLGAVDCEHLEANGLLTATVSARRTELTLTHPSVGEVLRAGLPILRGRALRRTVADGIERTGARRRGDVLKVAMLRLDGDGEAPRDVLAAAAHEAFFANAFGVAERLARAAEAVESAFETRNLLDQILYRQGREEIEPDDLGQPKGTDEERALQTINQAAAAFWLRGRRDEADQLLDQQIRQLGPSSWRDELVGLRANIDVSSAEPALALQRLDGIEASTGRPFVVAALVKTLALPHVGRAEDALRFVEPARAAYSALGDLVSMYQSNLLSSTESSALFESGSLVAATDAALRGYHSSADAHDTAGQAFNALALGRVLLARGMMVSALRWSREAAVLMDAIGHPGPLRWALGGVALAAAMRRDIDVAGAALARLDDGPSHPAIALNSDIERARAWQAVATGDPVTARQVLIDLSGFCRDHGLVALEVAALHDLARLDRANDVVDRILGLVEGVQGHWLPALAADAVALANRKADALAASAETLGGLGANLIAAETATRTAAALAAGGNQREASRWRRRAADFLAECEGARTPAIAQADGPAPLTDREREIALLAAAGLTSKKISERLFLSVRTVDNNLARVYVKLGIADRSAIASVLGPLGVSSG